MTKKLTVAQFANEFKFSINTAWKWIKTKELLTHIERVNNKEVTVVMFSDDEYNNLFKKRFGDDDVNNTVNDIDYEDSLSGYEVVNNTQSQSIKEFDYNKNIEVINGLMNEVIKSKDQLINYAEQAGQVKLLTDSENKTKEEYFRLVQENAVLKTQIEQLKKENGMLKQKTFFGFKFNKKEV